MRSAKEAADSHVAAFNAHDAEGHAANETPDIEWVQPGGIVLRGPDQVIASQRLFWEAFPDAKVNLVNQIVADPFVVTEGTFTGTQTGTLRTPNGDIPPTGKAIKLRYVSVQRVEKGLIASEHLYFDQAEMMAQLGLMPS
jgi:steroid delta-isomerase-like uncharacterized protein